MKDPVSQVDMIFVLGNKSDALPGEAAKLYRQGLAPFIVLSGGYGRLTKNDKITEADRYMAALRQLNIPSSAVLVERESTNTGEEIAFSKKLLASKSLHPAKAIGITTAMLSRRHQATLPKLWPSVTWMVHTPQPIPFDVRISRGNVDEFFNLMVGEVTRLRHYPAKGFMDKVDIPKNVADANDALRAAGYTRYLVTSSETA